MQLETVAYEKRPGYVALVSLNRPDKLNAISEQMWRDLLAVLEEAEGDPEVRALVLTGNGRAFSAGADIGPGQEPRDLLGWVASEERQAQRRRFVARGRGKPIVAAVHGWTLGLGFELAISCDMVIAAEDARLGAPEIRFGSIVSSILPWLIGPQWAKRLILTGDVITAEKAKEIGLVLEVVPREQLLDTALGLAERIAAVPPLAVRFNKRMIDGALEMAGIDLGQEYGAVVAAVCQTLMPQAEALDGRNLEEVRQREGWKAFVEARDKAFKEARYRPPWVVL